MKSWFATALLVVVVVAVTVTGIYGISGQQGGVAQNAVISAGSRRVTSDMFKSAFERYRSQVSQQTQQQVSLQQAVAEGLDRRVLEGLAQQESLAELLTRIGINPSDRLVAQQLRQITAFFDPVTGRFDEQLYLRQIQQFGLTPETFEDTLRSDVARQHVSGAAGTGFQAPRAFSVMEALLAYQMRDADFVAIPASQIQRPPPPTDAQLQAFMNENAAEMRLPELRTITVVRFSAQALAPSMTVDAAAVQRAFDFQRDTLSTPERRTFVQIPIRQASQAAGAVARLNRGEDPAVVARSLGVDPIRYDNQPQSAIGDRNIRTAAFAMAVNETRGPVQGDVGLAVLRVTAITPGRVATFEEHRATIENRLKAEAAERRAFALSEAYERAHRNGQPMAAAAAAAGANAVTIGPMAANGASLTSRTPNPILTPQILQTAFRDLAQGQESDIIEVGRGESFAVRVERVQPPAIPPLAEVRETVANQFTMQTMARELRRRIDAIKARMERGEALAAIAAAVNGQVGHVAGMTLATAQQQQQRLGQDFLQGLFNTQVGRIFIGQVQGGVAAARVTAVRNGDMTAIARLATSSREAATQQIMGNLSGQMQEYAFTAVRARTDLNRARQAIGVDPATVPGATNAASNAAAPAR